MKIPRFSRLLKGFGFFEYLLIFSPIADALVGIGKHNDIGIISAVGPAHKIFLLAYVLLMVITSKKVQRWQVLIILASILACFLHIFYVILAYGTGDIVDNLNTTVRFWFFPIVVASIMSVYSGIDNREKLHRVLMVIGLLYAALLLIPTLLGINNASYEDWLEKAGSVGFFYEANEIGIICGLLGAYMLMYYFLKKPSIATLFVTLAIVAAGLATGTKAALVYLAVAMIYVIIKTLLRLKRLTVNIVGFAIVIGSVAYFAQGVVSNISGSYERQVVGEAGGLADIVFNGRDRLLADSTDNFTSQYSSLDRALGDSSVGLDGVPKKDTEMDFSDILFHFGIVGLGVYLVSILYLSHKVLTRRTLDKISIEKVCFATGLFAAALMGHTLSSPSVGLILAILAVMIMSQREVSGAKGA